MSDLAVELEGVTKTFGTQRAVNSLNLAIPAGAIYGFIGPNGSGKSNVAEAFRFVLGEQSIKSMRGKRGEDLIFNGAKNDDFGTSEI